MFRKLRAFAVLIVVLGGCATPGSQGRDADQQARLDALAQAQRRLELRVDEVARSLLAQRERLDAQEGALREFRKELAEQRTENAQPPLPVVKVEPLPAAPPEPPDLKANAPPLAAARSETPPSAAPVSEPTGEMASADLYRRAYGAFREGRFGQAILDFEEFIRQHPAHEYADNAQYWLGECYYSQGECNQALVEFSRVLERYPNEKKAPDALLKMGMCYEKLGDVEKARALWSRLVSQFSETDSALQARSLLSLKAKP